jgi:two-component system sensor kinase FixL
MFGYSAQEVAGWDVSLLMPENEQILHGQYVRNYLATGKTKFLGTGRQVVGLRKDGREFPMDLGINEMRLDGQIMFVGSCRDISEIVKANAALKRHAEELARSNAELEQFAYVASHDLQEPLRKVQAFGDRMMSNYSTVLDERGLDYINRMRDAASRMQALVEDLLEFSRIASKGQPFVPVDLAQVAREVASDLEIRIQETKTLLEIADLPTIRADPLQMRQLFQNLIANAVKYRRQNTSHAVQLKADIEEDWGSFHNGSPAQICQILVKDNGIGFEEKYADRIFGIFQRLHGRSEFEGTGVGLAICRKICERHGGNITAEGRPGDGATFIVTLPVNDANNEAA